MAKLNPISDSVKFSKNVWKGGIGAGALTGTIQGTFGAIGFHQFFSRMLGGAISSAIVKDQVTKKIILVESSKEAMYQLLAGE